MRRAAVALVSSRLFLCVKLNHFQASIMRALSGASESSGLLATPLLRQPQKIVGLES